MTVSNAGTKRLNSRQAWGNVNHRRVGRLRRDSGRDCKFSGQRHVSAQLVFGGYICTRGTSNDLSMYEAVTGGFGRGFDSRHLHQLFNTAREPRKSGSAVVSG